MAKDEDDKQPLQFTIRAMLGLMVAVSLVFGTLRWLEVSPAASAVVLVILIVGGLAAVALLAAIARMGDDDREA